MSEGTGPLSVYVWPLFACFLTWISVLSGSVAARRKAMAASSVIFLALSLLGGARGAQQADSDKKRACEQEDKEDLDGLSHLLIA